MDLNGPFTQPPGNPGGVQVKTTAWGSIGNIARPGPGLPGLPRFRPFPISPVNDNALALLVAFDGKGNSGDQAAVSSWSGQAVWLGDYRMLAIDIPFMGAAGTVSAVTYGGGTCTLVGAQNVVGGTGRVEQWRICQNDSGAPPPGSNLLSV